MIYSADQGRSTLVLEMCGLLKLAVSGVASTTNMDLVLDQRGTARSGIDIGIRSDTIEQQFAYKFIGSHQCRRR